MFQSTKLAPLAVIQSRTRLLPYQGWHIRPSSGEQGGEAILSVDVWPIHLVYRRTLAGGISSGIMTANFLLPTATQVGLEDALEFHVLEKQVKFLGPS